MDRVRNLLEQIKGRLEELNKAERKVAEVILQNPQQATVAPVQQQMQKPRPEREGLFDRQLAFRHPARQC